MKKIFKKLASMILTAATTLTAINLTPLAQTVSADSWVTGENVNVTCNYFPYTFNFSGSGLTSIFGQFPNMTANGQIAYCSDSLADSGGGGNISRFTVKDNYSDNSPVSLAIAYGYTGRTKYGYSAETEQLATQIVIWCIQDGWYDNSSESTALNYFTANMGNTLASNVKTVYGKIKANMKEYGKVPSFSSNRERELIYNSTTKKWSLTLTDRNGVADQFNWSSILSKYSYLSVSATSDSVTFTSTKAFDTKTINANFNKSEFTAIKAVRLIPIAGQTNQQECISYKTSADPPTATVKLYAEESTGDLKIIKTSDDGKVSGITFTVRTTGMTEVGKYTTDSNGEIVIGDLKAGTYVVFESVPQGYENQEAQTITVESGKTAVVKFNNVLKKGDLKIIKTSEDGNVEGISFRVIDTSTGALLGTYTTGKNGEILVGDLKPGKYAVVEAVPAGYEKQETKYVTVESGKTAEVSFKNVLKKSEIITSASISGEKAAFTKQNDIITVDDIVSCADLIKGREYTVKGILMNKATGAAFTVNGRPITAESIFTAGSTSGLVKVSFSFPASAITDKTELVVFESLYSSGVKIAEHSDINDEGQTVRIHVPSISTAASVNGVKEIYSASGTVTIKDTVSYTDLISSSSFAAGVDSEYILRAVLMDKGTGEPFLVNGKQITAEKRFTAAGEKGSVDVYLTFDASCISAKTELVVFESLYFHGSKIAEHSDINDKGQTVTVHAPSIGTIATANGSKEIFSASAAVVIKDTGYINIEHNYSYFGLQTCNTVTVKGFDPQKDYFLLPSGYIQLEIPPSAFELMLTLYMYSFQNPFCYPSFSQIKKLCHLGGSTIVQGYKILEEKNVISKENYMRADGSKGHNRYFLVNKIERLIGEERTAKFLVWIRRQKNICCGLWQIIKEVFTGNIGILNEICAEIEKNEGEELTYFYDVKYDYCACRTVYPHDNNINSTVDRCGIIGLVKEKIRRIRGGIKRFFGKIVRNFKRAVL